MRILSNTIQSAISIYPCDACDLWLNSGYEECDVSADDWLIIQGAKSDNWTIKRGQKYRKIVAIDNGQFSAYRARLDMDALCNRLDFYAD